MCDYMFYKMKYVIDDRTLSEAHIQRLSDFKCYLVYLYPNGLKSLYGVLNRKIRSVVNRHLRLRPKCNVCTQIKIDGIMILLRKIFGGIKMELEIYLKYKAFTRAEILRKDGRELSSDDELCYNLDFWRKNKHNLKCAIKDEMKAYHWDYILEPVVDEYVIDFPRLEFVTVGQSYDVFTNMVTCRLVLKLELWDGATLDDICIHKKRMKWNILEWLNDNNGFIRLKNSELRFLTNDEMIYGIPTTEVRYDDLDVKFKLRK